MKTDLFTVSADPKTIAAAIDEVVRAAEYQRLSARDINTLRLLTEESINMTLDVLKHCEGKLSLTTNGLCYEIHISVDAPIDEKAREEFISVSKAKKNTAPKGIKAKLSYLFDGLFESAITGCGYVDPYGAMNYGFLAEDSVVMHAPYITWSMNAYAQSAPKEADDLQGIEKTIVEKVADDVVVTVYNNRVEMVVKKTFAA